MKDKEMEICHLDLNLAKLPIVHVRGRDNGKWVFETGNGKVEGTRRLTLGETKLYMAIMAIYEKAGMPESGEFFDFQNSIIRDLKPGVKRKTGIGGFEKKELKKQIENISMTFIHFHGTFQENGVTRTTMVSFPLLSRVDLFEREKSDKYFELSKFRLPKEIVDNMRAGFWKPLLMTTILSLKSDTELALLFYLDRMLSNQDYFHKDLHAVCDAIGISYSRDSDYMILKKACKGIVGKTLSCGHRVALCQIEKSQTVSGFKLTSTRGNKLRLTESSGKEKENKSESEPNEDRENRILIAYYNGLEDFEKKFICDRVVTISKEINGGFWNTEMSLETAKIESIKRFQYDNKCLNLVKAAARQNIIIAREPSAQYGPDLHVLKRHLINKLGRLLTSIIASKTPINIIPA